MFLRKHILLLFGFLFLTFSSSGQQLSDESNSTQYSNSSTLADSIINYGKTFLDTPYRYAGTGPNSFDCSGFSSFVYHHFGYELDHSSAGQAEQFSAIKRSTLKPGDLVFFAGSSKSKRVGHVGIVVNANEEGKFNFIHASCDHGVVISSSEEPYYSSRYIKANRVINETPLEMVASENVNQDKTEPVPTSPKVFKKTIPAKFHTVKKGETLSEIAEKYGLTVASLKNKNGIRGNKLKLKQRLKVKEAQTYTESESTQIAEAKSLELAKKSATKSDNQPLTHKVLKGETLFSISKSCGLSVAEIKELNAIEGNAVKLGQLLVIAKTPEENNKPVASSTRPKVEKAETKPIAKTEIKPEVVTEEAQIQEEIPEVVVRIEPKQESKSKPASSTRIIVHKVHSGENLATIARDFKVSLDELKRINNLEEIRVNVGQEVFICLNPDVVVINPFAKTISNPVVTKQTTTNGNDELTSKAEQKAKEIEPEKVLPSKTITYKVKKKETLARIAVKFNMTVAELKELNDLSSTKVQVGQRLVVSQLTTETLKNKNSKSETKPKTIHHKVKSGESYSTIAHKYKCHLDDLKDWNRKVGSHLQPGDVLIIKSSKK